LREIINPYFLRRKKSEVLHSLPDKIEQDIYVDLHPKQRKMYDSIVKKLKLKIDNKKITVKSAIAQFTRTRQICGTTATLTDKDYSASLDALEDLVKNYLYGEHKFFIVSPFKATVKCAYERLRKMKIGCVYVDGDTNAIDGNKFIDKFQENSKCKCYIGTIDKNKEAITLTAGDYVIFLGKSLVPAINDQVVDRLRRIGQKKVVNVINILNRDTVEERIEENILAPKERLCDDFFDGTGRIALRLRHIRKLI
jgi:SNF2 family DNA or RNA helicase